VLLSFGMKAQLLDTLQELFHQKYSIDARLESRNSFIDHQLVSVNGARLGLSFARKFKLGIGLSWLNSEVKSTRFTAENPDYLKFGYIAYYLDYVFYKTKRWQLSVPIQAGTGMSWYQPDMTYHFKTKTPKYLLLLYEPGITVQFKVFKWAGLGADVAYRFTVRSGKDIDRRLSSPTYSFKLLFWFDQLFYDLFPASIITKEFGPSYW
jgi:hypothetical protein